LKKLSVSILGATGLVGQRFVQILDNHPWFEINNIAASKFSSGKTYEHALNNRWSLNTPVSEKLKNKIVLDSCLDIKKIAESSDFVFSAVNMNKEEIKKLEYNYAKLECPVISNNSAHRETPDVPMIIPEINFNHAEIINSQIKRLNTKYGFIAVKPNCTIQCFLPALHVLREYILEHAIICTYQAISGAGKTFENFPEIINNIIPFIQNEELKTEQEPLKIWGEIKSGKIIPAEKPVISSQCTRVPVSNGHTATVFAKFKIKPELNNIIKKWQNFSSEKLPSSPEKIINYFDQEDRPQIKLEKNICNGMGISVGKLRTCPVFDIKFVCTAHNIIRGAAGGSILLAELLYKLGYLHKK
jgi:aspartate-semialdehyde dehydrogenase